MNKCDEFQQSIIGALLLYDDIRSLLLTKLQKVTLRMDLQLRLLKKFPRMLKLTRLQYSENCLMMPKHTH